MRNVLIFTLLLGMLPAADADPPAVYSGAEISGRVIDAKTGEAIEGAVIVASWQIFEPSFFHAGAVATFHAGEAVSGKDGTYTVPSWDSIPRPFGWEMEGGQDPVLYIFKPGYESEVKGNVKWRTAVQTGPLSMPGAHPCGAVFMMAKTSPCTRWGQSRGSNMGRIHR